MAEDELAFCHREKISKMEPQGSSTVASGATVTAPMLQNISWPMRLGPNKVVITCPHCQSGVKTSIKHTTTSRTHLVAAICFFICCCCCLPYCMTSTKNTDHYCPSCFKYIGTYEK